ncbi:hypothetical protein BDV32DRAFT_59988 [Aspergillus pseudonomiae]|uniref:Uncharacterized protein n=1 Tax=Aspergillus pseudonomiae TaxID=1506151 RepID=A0A5N6I2L3_9EURO|nr:uncharacterized protein BDV37DRAFT_101649 [Aspergillus pseudonomiae]KAB8259313.1 hypothetical protein BDV32DRAFT_59988 [Aspergillus pseudonomiae]KAE8405064.1 hypothetical protein BDV37DRAFT_101649 [Aspergillus pseudonomiae]
MYECETCRDTFWDQDDYEWHMEDYGHWPECETCYRTFRSSRACHQHMNDASHWAPRFNCETCSRDFNSQTAANQHMTAVGHWAPRVPCETCNMRFSTEQAAESHMKSKAHFKNYCRSCEIRFQSENDLRMHLNSKIHRGKNVQCPFCKANYTSASGLAHHLERGSCPRASTLNRETILRIVHKRDPQGVITNKQIEWYKEDSSHYSATDHAFNGSSWECYLCHRGFRSVKALDSHLNSSVHKQNVYHCPNSNGRCVKQFTTLAALFNHLESEACSFMRFEKVRKNVDRIFQSRKTISFGQ